LSVEEMHVGRHIAVTAFQIGVRLTCKFLLKYSPGVGQYYGKLSPVKTQVKETWLPNQLQWGR